MYHSVSRDRPDWIWNHLITPVDVFEGQMRALKETGWTAISLDLLHSHMAKGTPVPEKSVVLTFDDGYLDNWVYAFPILRKYGNHAVIWLTTDFVDPRTDLRPTIEDVWSGKISEDALDPRGYLSWAEMREMVRSGVVEIQSHAKTHTWYFSGPAILDFHRPRGVEGYQLPPWLAWNLFPEEKPQSLVKRFDDRIRYGTPIYQHEKSMIVRRYFEDQELDVCLVRTVAEGGGPAFFNKRGWREILFGVVKAHKPTNARFETEEEYTQRVRSELIESRDEISRSLGTRVDFLCWPGGAYNPVTLEIAKEVGYLATTTHHEDPQRRNVFGQDPREINRVGSGSPCVCRGRILRRTEPEFFIETLEYFAGNKKSLWTLRRLKLKYLAQCRFGKREEDSSRM
jgi:peptidoglycan/xylan/chitin deacetylase (PgdA/CDA1 family)